MQLIEMKGKNDSATSEKIISWEKDKQANEQEMLKALNDLFKQSIPTENVRRVVLAAFDTMVTEVSEGKVGPTQNAIEDEKNLAVWLKTHQLGWNARLYAMWDLLGRGKGSQGALDCDDLSELIRVVGAWLEKGGGFGGYPDINKALRVGVGRAELVRADERDNKVVKALPTGPNKIAPDNLKRIDDHQGQLWNKQFRSRENLPKDLRKKDDSGRLFPEHPQIKDHVKGNWVRPKDNKLAGTEMFRVNKDDLCKKIDLLFGLYKGATLSGTTTDTVFVLETFGQQIGVGKQLHPGYYLFPAATIAASLHHTLLEVALSLTLDGAIESYCVGFYTTLQPKGGFPMELEKAQGILEAAEKDPSNRHLVIWYDEKDKDEGKPVGCLLLDKKVELIAYRRLVEATGLLTHVRDLPPVPTKNDVIHFIQLMAPNLLAHLPQEFQGRRLAA